MTGSEPATVAPYPIGDMMTDTKDLSSWTAWPLKKQAEYVSNHQQAKGYITKLLQPYEENIDRPILAPYNEWIVLCYTTCKICKTKLRNNVYPACTIPYPKVT